MKTTNILKKTAEDGTMLSHQKERAGNVEVLSADATRDSDGRLGPLSLN